jgi:hypothetical protein
VIKDRLSKAEEQLKGPQTKTLDDFSNRLVQAQPAQMQSFTPSRSSAGRQALFADLNCWEPLEEDLKLAQNAVVVVSPYLTIIRTFSCVESSSKSLQFLQFAPNILPWMKSNCSLRD